MKLLNFKQFESEAAVAPSAPSTTGVAMAGQSTTSGMGNVVSSQPSSTPGAAVTGDGTVGSGDISYPGGIYQKAGATGQKYVKTKKTSNSKKKKKKKKKNKKNENFEYSDSKTITLNKMLIIDLIISTLDDTDISKVIDLPDTIHSKDEYKNILYNASDNEIEQLLFLILD